MIGDSVRGTRWLDGKTIGLVQCDARASKLNLMVRYGPK